MVLATSPTKLLAAGWVAAEIECLRRPHRIALVVFDSAFGVLHAATQPLLATRTPGLLLRDRGGRRRLRRRRRGRGSAVGRGASRGGTEAQRQEASVQPTDLVSHVFSD